MSRKKPPKRCWQCGRSLDAGELTGFCDECVKADVCTCGEQKVRLHVNGDPVHMACPAAIRDLVAGKENEVCQ